MKKLKTKALSSILALILFVGITPNTQAMTLEEATKDVMNITHIVDNILIQVKMVLENNFKDYKKNEWYSDAIAKLVGVGGIKGYPDNTIQVNGTITRAEFVKILISSIYGEQISNGPHWAGGYINKADEVGIIPKIELVSNDIDGPITRQETARLISRTLEISFAESKATNIEDVKAIITDKSSISNGYAEHIYNAYGKGIITGYPDGSFKPSNTATRAEASAMLVRMLDASTRVVVGYKTVEELGIIPQSVTSLGSTFSSSIVTDLGIKNVYIIEKSSLPVKLSKNIVLHDISLSSDGKFINTIQECRNGAAQSGVDLAVKNEGIRSRNSIDYYLKDLGNFRYQTSHIIVDSIETDYKTFSLDKVEYFVFMDSLNKRFIAIEKGDALSD